MMDEARGMRDESNFVKRTQFGGVEDYAVIKKSVYIHPS